MARRALCAEHKRRPDGLGQGCSSFVADPDRPHVQSCKRRVGLMKIAHVHRGVARSRHKSTAVQARRLRYTTDASHPCHVVPCVVNDFHTMACVSSSQKTCHEVFSRDFLVSYVVMLCRSVTGGMCTYHLIESAKTCRVVLRSGMLRGRFAG